MKLKTALLAAAFATLSAQAFAGDLLEFDLNRSQAPASASRDAVQDELKDAQAKGTVQTGDVVVAPEAALDSHRSVQEVRAEAVQAQSQAQGHAIDTTLVN